MGIEKLSQLMRNVSLRDINKIGDEEVKTDELLIVFYRDDTSKYHSTRKVNVAASLMQLDAVLCSERELDCVLRVKITDTYR